MLINGIVPIIPTPFLSDTEVDLESLRGLVEFAVRAGACAFCLPAYGSEFYKLSEEERREVIVAAVAQAKGRIPVIAQVNTPSLRQAVRAAAAAHEMGASAVNVAVPRLFPLPEPDLERYFGAVLEAVDLPVIIQDFNPGGPTVSPQFVARLNALYPHFRYIKLEEPLMAAKVKAILEAAGGRVGVLEGWGGMYMLELVETGICGCMPGLALTDLLAMVFRSLTEGRKIEAYEIFQGVLPQIVYCLQNLELYHHAEKLLLQARGVLSTAVVRDATMELSADEREHIRFLNERVLELLTRLGLPHNPAAVSAV